MADITELRKAVAEKRKCNELKKEERKLTEELERGTLKGEIKSVLKNLWRSFAK